MYLIIYSGEQFLQYKRTAMTNMSCRLLAAGQPGKLTDLPNPFVWHHPPSRDVFQNLFEHLLSPSISILPLNFLP